MNPDWGSTLLPLHLAIRSLIMRSNNHSKKPLSELVNWGTGSHTVSVNDVVLIAYNNMVSFYKSAGVFQISSTFNMSYK